MLLSRLTGLDVTPDKKLAGRSGGGWEGLSDEEIRERYPAERATWARRTASRRPLSRTG